MSSDNYKIIYSFNDVDITEKTLIVCDIDDTLLRYEVSWQYYFFKYMQEFNNYEIAESRANREWFHYTKANNCFLVDKEGFTNFMNKIKETNSVLVFLTARIGTSHPYTIENFEHIGLDHTQFDIHYSHTISKGLYLHEQLYKFRNYDYSNYKKIVFIDDALHNILNMNHHLPNVECYLFLGSPNGQSVQTTFL
jgi:hypothetical protein